MNIHDHRIQYSRVQITISFMTLLLLFASVFPTAAPFSSQATLAVPTG